MGIPFTDLLRRVPAETERLVEQTRQRFNQAVRQALRVETRLQLGNSGTGERGEERDVGMVRVAVTAGMPEVLRKVEFDEELALSLELAPLTGLLATAHRAILDLEKPIERLAQRADFSERFFGADYAIWGMRDLLVDLLAEAAKVELLRKVFTVNEDVLGLYSYRLPGNRELLDDEPALHARVDLYWGVIALVAKVLGVSVEALTTMVLAHELGHAYTHLGSDADGKRWDPYAFAESQPELKEGLAQYYTVRVLERLAGQMPEALHAYKKLLPLQSEAYRTHLSWQEKFTPEEVRLAMISVRRNGGRSLDEFQHHLDGARRQIRGKEVSGP